MYPHVTPNENYTTDWRSILLFDEKRDGFRRISLHDAITKCGRWTGSGHLEDVDRDDKGNPTHADMFVNGGKLAETFGDLSFDALPKKARDDWVLSAMKKLPKDVNDNLEALRKFVKEVDPAQCTPTTFDELNAFYTIQGSTIPLGFGTGLTVGGISGGKNVGVPFDDGKPYGFGNLTGIREMASSKYSEPTAKPAHIEYHKLAKKALKAVDDTYKVIYQINCHVTEEEIFLKISGFDKMFPILHVDLGAEHALSKDNVEIAAQMFNTGTIPGFETNAYGEQILSVFKDATLENAEALLEFSVVRKR
jgi:hypothetical protein